MEEATDPLACGSLYAITGPYTERTFPVKEEGGLIGRSRKCPVSLLHDCEVSHNHAMVEPHAQAGSGFCIRDIGSTFGTYLNDKRLSEPKRASEPYKLKPGDTVKVGQTTLRWQPRQHLDAAASVLRIPPPPRSPAGARGGGARESDLAKVGEHLEKAHRVLCNTAAAVELAVVARRLEQLLRAQAQADSVPALGAAAEREEWRTLLRQECDSLSRDVTTLIGSQREALRKLLVAQSGVWAELRAATAELAGGAGGPPLPATALQWMRDANHHARWGFKVVRQAQLWLDALDDMMQATALTEAPLAPYSQRQRMLDADARSQLAALRACLAADPIDAREALEARERLAVTEWELLRLHRLHPALADSPMAVRSALALDPASVPEAAGPDHIARLLPWSLRAFSLRPPPSPPVRALAGGELGCLGMEALLDESLCILQPCRRPVSRLSDLHTRLVRLSVRQAEGAPGTQFLPAVRAVWREGDGTLWVHLAHLDDSVSDAASCPLPPGDTVLAQLASNWRGGFVDLAAALSTLHRLGLAAAGVTARDIALDHSGHVVLLALGLARLGGPDRPTTAGDWGWAALPPEAHDAARGNAADGGADATHEEAEEAAAAGGAPVAPPSWAADMWGVGVLLWRAHFGEDPTAIVDFLNTPRAERPPCVRPPERADTQLAHILSSLLRAAPAERMPACTLLAHPLLQPLPATSRASSLPDTASALLSADDDAAHVAAALSHARSSLADLRTRARAEAPTARAGHSHSASGAGPAATITVGEETFCEDLLQAVEQLSDAELVGALDVRLRPAAGGPEVPLSVEAALTTLWERLIGDQGEPLHSQLFDDYLCAPLGVRASALGDMARDATPPASAERVEGGPEDRAGSSSALRALLHPGAPVPAESAPEALFESIGRLLFKGVLEALPLPLASLPAYWWRAAVGLGAASGLPELDPLAPLLALQFSALTASGTTDGWMLDMDQVKEAPADVPQSKKLRWLAGKVRLDLWARRERTLTALHRGFARAARGTHEGASAVLLQQLPAEVLMLAATGGVPARAKQLLNMLDFRDFPEGSPMPTHLCTLIELMSATQLRRFILLLTGFVDLPPLRPDGTHVVITVKYWPNATDCAPIAHRAALALDLPWYSSFDKLRQMLCRTLEDMPEAQPMSSYVPDDFEELAAKWIAHSEGN